MNLLFLALTVTVYVCDDVRGTRDVTASEENSVEEKVEHSVEGNVHENKKKYYLVSDESTSTG